MPGRPAGGQGRCNSFMDFALGGRDVRREGRARVNAGDDWTALVQTEGLI
jgi:hypothetical protein